MPMKSLQALQINSGRRDEWNAFVSREPSFALLQSWEWGEFKEQLGWKAFRVAVEVNGKIFAGAQMLIKPLLQGLAGIAYVPRGPIGCWLEKETASLLSELHQIARAHNAIFLKVEPPLLNDAEDSQSLKQLRFRSSHLYNQPTATIVIDLRPDLEGIAHGMRKRTWEYIKQSTRKGVTVRAGTCKDIADFIDMMRLTAKRERFPPRTRSYYEHEWQMFNECNEAVLLMAFYEDQLLGVHMAFRFGEHAAYFHGGSSKEFSYMHPNYLLMWEAIKWAKEQGCRTYDLWGIPEEIGEVVSCGNEAPVSERFDGLWGVYHFKRGFCKNVVAYVGSWDYVYNPIVYRLITNRILNVTTVDSCLAWIDSLKRDEINR